LVVEMTLRAVLVLSLLAVSGCGTTSTMTGSGAQPGGTVVASADGTGKARMVGGLITGSIGEGLGSGDKRKALEAEYKALEYTPGGQKVAWTGDRAGRSGEVVPAQPYRVGSQDCRQFSHTVKVDGQTRNARGTACRNEDGSWATLG
jgi:surface antigen